VRNQTLDESGATFDATFGTGVQEDLQTRSTYALAAAQQSHAHHIRVFCSTWAPESISDLAEATTAARSQLNQWILDSGVCDDTVDWATVLADPNVPQTYNPL